ncbi:MAG: hypothetical protein MUO40_09285 [Anaerolineaceae bacterium]|nr:hypothetical protein [Anaerolineaceae bacterium]
MVIKPSIPVETDPSRPYKVKLGIRMFIAYFLFYISFVAINLLNPLVMAKIVFAGLNLATVYGFMLIIVAVIEALVYDWFCRRKERYYIQKPNEKEGE